MNNKLIYGKNILPNIVSVEVKDDTMFVYQETKDGVTVKELPNKFWMVTHGRQGPRSYSLQGNLHYDHRIEFKTRDEYVRARAIARNRKMEYYSVYEPKEGGMINNGVTYFKGMQVEDVSTLSFDIETTSLGLHSGSKVLLISNTFRRNGKIEKKLFAYDEYNNDAQFFNAWASWVREKDPSVMLGHNIFSYDLPYLTHCATMAGTTLKLGRDGSDIAYNKYTSSFRKDGSQSYDYTNGWIYGREIIDTMFLSIKYDIGRKYESYALKKIVSYEGLEKKDRQFYDAATIKDNYTNPKEWDKIKEYAKDDADDSLALYDLMIPSFFYLNQSIPKPFQQLINTATGSQINAFMIRAYMQDNHSLPKTSEAGEFEGAVSLGLPGIYKNVAKVDVASLYPSIMREYKVCNTKKDPKQYFLETIEHFTLERLKNKQLGKTSKHHKDLDQSQKIFINSAYGFLGAPGLLFNSPGDAAFITRKGREILLKGVEWATGHTLVKRVKHIVKEGTDEEKKQYEWVIGDKVCSGKGFELVNVDTDSFSYTNGKKIDKEQFAKDIVELNSLYPSLIKWEDDGTYKNVLVIKAKNYVLDDGKKVTIKGSALKATNKESRLKEFIDEIINLLLTNKKDHILYSYNEYAREIMDIQDISQWCTKKTITKAVLHPERTNERRVKDALCGTKVQEGDKVYMFFKTKEELCLRENFDGEYDTTTFLNKLYKTLEVFKTVMDIDMIPNYKLKKNKDLLDELAPVLVDGTLPLTNTEFRVISIVGE